MRRELKRKLSAALGGVLAASMVLSTSSVSVLAANNKASEKYQTRIEFENANRFEQNGRNRIDSSMFSGYSGSGYVYLEAGWGEVNFTVPQEGDYKITIATNADQYKKNWLYLDSNGAGEIHTNGNRWDTYTNTYHLTAGEHKFGLSSDWGYTALDYVDIESVDAIIEEPETEESSSVVESSEEQSSEEQSSEEQSSEEPSSEEQSSEEQSSESSETFTTKAEFEDANKFEQNGRNRIESGTFSNYSGSGYLYLEAGWGEVNFTVPEAGQYKITIVSNADQYKENWLYLDDNGAGTLKTSGNKWESYSDVYTLSAGTHKFGVSASWGYVALDYVLVEAIASSSTPEESEEESEEESSEIEETQPSGDGMFVKNGKLYDSNGNEFIMRGVNVAHAWYTGNTQTSINAIADLGANCVRVVLADGTQWDKTSRSEVESIISMCEAKGLICVLEVHDHTGKDDTSRLNTAVNYWLEIKDLLNAHKDYVIVNIANEWLGTWELASTWTSAYQSAIRTLRNNGIENVLMIDSSGYGQETSTCINNCNSVLSADSTGNTMFSLHLYSVAGKDASTVKSNIDGMLSTGAAFCIGEFGDYQNGGDVDEATIMQYCTEKGVGYMAWSWKGNGGTDITLDMSKTWDGSELTTWGQYVFYASGTGIQDTSRMAYTLKYFDGTKHDGDVETPTNPDEDSDVITPDKEVDADIDAGYLSSLEDWFVSGEGDDSVSDVSTLETLSNGGIRLNFNLKEEEYPYLTNFTGGLDLSGHTTIDVVVRNNNLYNVQLQPIFKVGDLWKWTEYDQYQKVPAKSTVMLSFSLEGCANLDEVNAIMFRVQGGGSTFAGTLDFVSIVADYDYSADPFSDAIAELNRPKTAAFYTWKYPENDWSNCTEDYSCDENGVITVNFKNVTESNAAGPQTETRPGTGEGSDFTAYGKLLSTITNNCDKDVHVTLVMKTTGNWTWQENAGIVDGESGELVIAPGESVDVVYSLVGSTWKSKATNWAYTGKLDGLDDVRAIAYKIYANEGETVSGSVTISDFSLEF